MTANIVMGQFFVNNNGKLNIGGGVAERSGGTVEVLGEEDIFDNDIRAALKLERNGNNANVQVNVTDGGLLKLHAAEDVDDGYCYVIDFDTWGGNNASKITISGTGVMELYPRTKNSKFYVPAMRHKYNAAADIDIRGKAYIKYVGCNAMDMIDEDADDNGGVFQGYLDGEDQKFTPQDVNEPGKAYDQDVSDGIAWFYDGTDTYLFPAVDMTRVDAGPGTIAYWDEEAGSARLFMDSTLDGVDEDSSNFTFAWESDPATVTFDPTYGNTVLDPNVVFPELGLYTLKVTATRVAGDLPYVLVDYVNIMVATHVDVMVLHLAIDDGELDNGFVDSSTEGHLANHTIITDDNGSGYSHEKGIVGCDDGGSISCDDGGAIYLHLDHTVEGFDETSANLDLIDLGLTVALFVKLESNYRKDMIILEKEGTFQIRVDHSNDDIKTAIMMAGEDTYRDVSSKSNDLGDDLDESGLEIGFNDRSKGDREAWHHLAFTYDSITGVCRQYIDGLEINEESSKFDPGVRIATYPGETKFLTLAGGVVEDDNYDLRSGGIDDVRIYNYVLEGHEIAGLASMGETIAFVNAGSSMEDYEHTHDLSTHWHYNGVDPNDFPVQLDGAYAKLGRGITKISTDDDDDKVMWEMISGTGTATFSNSNDPLATVTFSTPGDKRLQLTSYERFCGNSNDHYDRMTVTVRPAGNCQEVKDAGWNYAGDLDGDCDVDGDDLVIMAGNWLDVVPAP